LQATFTYLATPSEYIRVSE